MKLLLILILTILVTVTGCNLDEDYINSFGENACYKVRTYVASNKTDTTNVYYTITVSNYATQFNKENINRVTNFVIKTQDDIVKICGGVLINPIITTRNDITYLNAFVYIKETAGYIISLYLEFYLYRLRINYMIDSLDKNTNKIIMPDTSINKSFETCAYSILVENGKNSDIKVGRGDKDNIILASVIIGSFIVFGVTVICCYNTFKKCMYNYNIWKSNNKMLKEKRLEEIRINDAPPLYYENSRLHNIEKI